MGAHALSDFFNELRKSDQMRGSSSILSLFRNGINKYNNTGTGMLDWLCHMTLNYDDIAFFESKRLMFGIV